MLKSWSQKGKSKLSNGLAFLVNPIFPKKSSVTGEAAPETELTAPGADSEVWASWELNMSENDVVAVVAISGGASSPGHHPEPNTRPAAVGGARLNQFGGTRDGRRRLPNPAMPGSSSNRVAGQPRMADAGVGLELRLSNRLLGATQSSAGIVGQDDESIPDLESQLVSNEDGDAPVSGEDGDAPVSGVREHLNVRAPLQAAYIMFGLGTNVTLALINVKVIHELKLPGSAPTLSEGVFVAAAGIGLLTSLSATCLQVKDPRSALAKVLSQISVIILGSLLLVKLSTWFLFEQYVPVNIVTTAGLFLFMVGSVIWAGISTAANQVAGARAVSG